MVLRIRFTPHDLGRVRVAGGPHPLWETVLSINGLQQSDLPPRYWAWRAQLGAAGRQERARANVLRAASAVVPAAGNFPDFLTPSLADADIEAHYDNILALPARTVRDDLTRTFRRHGRVPGWARRVHTEGRLTGVVGVLRRYHELAFAPVRNEVHEHVEAARSHYARRLLTGGLDALLSGLHPSIRWRSPVLEADYPVDVSIDLAGRGLLVVPAYFLFGGAVTFIDGDQPPTLVCPATPESGSAHPDRERAEDRLGRLLGPTRARVLAELGVAASTNQLATRLGVTPAAVSQHTRVLRDAGLLTTTRIGQSVRHALTPLGRDLLRGGD